MSKTVSNMGVVVNMMELVIEVLTIETQRLSKAMVIFILMAGS